MGRDPAAEAVARRSALRAGPRRRWPPERGGSPRPDPGHGRQANRIERVFGGPAIPRLTAPHPPALIARRWQGLRIDLGHPTSDVRARQWPVARMSLEARGATIASHPSPEKDREAPGPSRSTLHFALVHGGCGHKAVHRAVGAERSGPSGGDRVAGRDGGCERCTFSTRDDPGVGFSPWGCTVQCSRLHRSRLHGGPRATRSDAERPIDTGAQARAKPVRSAAGHEASEAIRARRARRPAASRPH